MRSRASKFTSSASVPYFGVFTDDPVIIAHRLGRPKTPFVPPPVRSVSCDGRWVDSDDATEAVGDSSPALSDLDSKNPREQRDCGIGTF
jgi:hypothetical protein